MNHALIWRVSLYENILFFEFWNPQNCPNDKHNARRLDPETSKSAHGRSVSLDRNLVLIFLFFALVALYSGLLLFAIAGPSWTLWILNDYVQVEGYYNTKFVTYILQKGHSSYQHGRKLQRRVCDKCIMCPLVEPWGWVHSHSAYANNITT